MKDPIDQGTIKSQTYIEEWAKIQASGLGSLRLVHDQLHRA